MLIQLSKILAPLKGDRRGVTALEYALMGSLIALAIIGAATSLGGKIANTFSNISNNLNGTTAASSSTPSSTTPPAKP